MKKIIREGCSRLLNFVEDYKFPIIIFIISRLIVFFILYLTNEYSLGSGSLFQWDASHYISIAKNGYVFNGQYLNEGSFIAFFPLYPIIIRIISTLTLLTVENSAIIASYIFGIASAILIYKIAVLKWGKDVGVNSVLLFSFFPMSVFLTTAYAESLFFFLVLSVFLLFEKKNLTFASILIGLAILTRITGFVLIPILIYELYKNKKTLIYSIFNVIITIIPFCIFLYFQYIKYGTLFAFIIAQKTNWHHEAVFPWGGLKNFLSHLSSNEIMWRVDFFFLLVMIATLIIATKRIDKNMLLFGWGVVILSLSQSFILGLSRYMMLVIPFYFYWGKFFIKHSLAKQLVIAVMASWMVFNTVLFILSKNIY